MTHACVPGAASTSTSVSAGMTSYEMCIRDSYIEAADDAADLDAAYDAVRKVFGIATITRAAACEKDKDAITALAKTYLHDAMTAARSFKVETKR